MLIGWPQLAYLLFRFVHHDIDTVPPASARGLRREKRLDLFFSLRIETPGPHSEVDVERIMDAIVVRFCATTALALESYPLWISDDIILIKSLRYALALAAGRPLVIAPHERAQIRAMLTVASTVPGYSDVAEHALTVLERADVSDSSGPLSEAVDFRFTWRPWSRHGKGDICLAAAFSIVHLPSMDHQDAPEFMGLRTGAESAWLPIRLVNEKVMRPLLAPGTWRAIDVLEFQNAARMGCAWADNPFLTPPFERSGAYLGVDDMVSAVSHPNRRDTEACSAAEAACLKRAGGLCVIGGIVHKATQALRLHVLVTRVQGRGMFARDARISLAWSMGEASRMRDVDLASWIDQRTYCGMPSPTAFVLGELPIAASALPGFAPEMQDVLIQALTLVGDMGQLEDLQVDATPVLHGHCPASCADLDEGWDIAEFAMPAGVSSGARASSDAQVWREANEVRVHRTFAVALKQVVENARMEREADLAILTSI